MKELDSIIHLVEIKPLKTLKIEKERLRTRISSNFKNKNKNILSNINELEEADGIMMFLYDNFQRK